MLTRPEPLPVQLTDSWLDALGVWATVGAAVVTAVTAVLIWLQIRQTRRSVEATDHALELARAEQEHNRRVMIDGQKARIDAEVPKLLVWVRYPARSVFDPRYPRRYVYGGDDSPDPRHVPADRVWLLAPEGHLPLAVEFGVNISNDGPRRARVSLGRRNDPKRGTYVEEVVIGVDEVLELTLSRTQTVAEWASIARGDYSPLAGTEASGGDLDVLTVTYIHQGTEGVIERWVVRQGGSPLMPASAGSDGWRLGPIEFDPRAAVAAGMLNAGIDLPSREYYGSMVDQRRLE